MSLMQMNLADVLMKIMFQFIPFLFALSFHEFAHGWVARKRGDNTAYMMGRLTMNPMPHMDILGTLIFPLMAILSPGAGLMFGWAKPVPVNERNLKSPRADMFWIALAGPASNMLLAVVSSFLLWFLAKNFITTSLFAPMKELLLAFIGINIVLAVFNTIPLHPLDGGKILARFLPAHINYKLEQNQHISGLIVLFLAFTILWKVIGPIVDVLYRLILFWA